jgi:hypothetical protein
MQGRKRPVKLDQVVFLAIHTRTRTQEPSHTHPSSPSAKQQENCQLLEESASIQYMLQDSTSAGPPADSRASIEAQFERRRAAVLEKYSLRYEI